MGRVEKERERERKREREREREKEGGEGRERIICFHLLYIMHPPTAHLHLYIRTYMSTDAKQSRDWCSAYIIVVWVVGCVYRYTHVVQM